MKSASKDSKSPPSSRRPVSKLWLEEAARRWEQIASGTVKAIPEERVMRAARNALKKRASI